MEFSIQRRLSKTEQINFVGEFKPAERVALVGRSGAGKSTLLRYLAGLNREGNVRVAIDGQVNTQPWKSCAVLLHQQPVLFSHHRVLQTLEFAEKFAKSKLHLPINTWLEQLELTPLLEKNCQQLSGGQAQRVVLLRALMSQPRWLLLDEPMSALDANRMTAACDVLAEYCELTQAGLVLASHHDFPQRYLCNSAYCVDQLTGQRADHLYSALNEQTHEAPMSTLHVNIQGIEHGFLASSIAEQTLYVAQPRQWRAGVARVSIPADEISIATANEHQTSMVNRLQCELVGQTDMDSAHILLTLSVDDQLLYASISKWSYQRLGLQLHQRLFAEFKVGAVHWQGQI